MKNKKVFFLWITILTLAVLAGTALFVLGPRSGAPEQVRAQLNEAQRVLGLLRNVEISYQGDSADGSFLDVSAKGSGREMIFSETWKAAGLPQVEVNGGFEYTCSAADGFCQATEINATGNGMKIDITSGEYECLGLYKPVVTQGFSGEDVIVGCQE